MLKIDERLLIIVMNNFRAIQTIKIARSMFTQEKEIPSEMFSTNLFTSKTFVRFFISSEITATMSGEA